MPEPLTVTVPEALLLAYQRLYEIVWNEVGTYESDDPKYSLVSYDDQTKIEDACVAIELLLGRAS